MSARDFQSLADRSAIGESLNTVVYIHGTVAPMSLATMGVTHSSLLPTPFPPKPNSLTSHTHPNSRAIYTVDSECSVKYLVERDEGLRLSRHLF